MSRISSKRRTSLPYLAIFAAVITTISLLVGKQLVGQDQDLRREAASCKEACPDSSGKLLQNCTPPEPDGSSSDSLCNVKGRIEPCGGRDYCCPAAGGKWTTDMSKCQTPTNTPAPTATKAPTATPAPTATTAPTATPTPPVTACKEECPDVTKKILRNCTPPESDGTSADSICNTAGRVESCGGKNYCCPTAGGEWTADLSKCPAISPTGTYLLQDINRDGKVDQADLTILLDNYGPSPTVARADFNQDGVVNAVDFAILMDAYGQTSN